MRTLIAALLAAALAACATNSSSEEPAPGEQTADRGTAVSEPGVSAPDTLDGTIAVVGAAPLTQVVIRPEDASGEVTLHGEAADALRRLTGLEVRLEGERDPERHGFAVQRFEVRALGETPAVDGVLIAEGDDVVLVRRDSQRVPLSAVPASLRQHIGARVWVAGSPEGRVESYGVIERERARR